MTRFDTLRLAAIALVAVLLFAASATGRSEVPRKGTFQAQWSIEGKQEALDFGPERSLSIFSHTGTVTVMRSDGLVGNALSKCIGLGDTAKGDTSRCVWVDSKGHKIYSELRAEPAESGSDTGRGRGTIVGGTGRFAGMQGFYELDWVAPPSFDGVAIEARSIRMQGSWQLPVQ